MPRAARSVAKRARHKKWLKRAKGFRGRRRRSFKLAKEAVLKAGQHAYFDRRKKKGQFRMQWQSQINAAIKQYDWKYSQFMHALKESNIEIDRKILAAMTTEHPEMFKQIVDQVKSKSTK